MSSDKEPDPVWVRAEVASPTDTVLWKIALLECQKKGFPLGTQLDPITMEVTTGWKNDLHPFRGKGNRKQAHIKMNPVGPGQWGVEIRVKMQINDNITRPLDLSYAEWEWVDDDQETAVILAHHIRTAMNSSIEARDRPDDVYDALLERAGLGDDDDDGGER